ncbi:MAG TPA: universal stress protein [Actinomycetota bacterium]|nr:universal stress protein [Actinomycetota bacterium]
MKVLVYVDGSDGAMRAVDRAIALAAGGAQVLALHVYPPRLDRGHVSHFEIEPEDLDIVFARKVLAAVEERFAAHGLAFESLILEGHLTGVIAEQAVRGGCDLILIGSCGSPRVGIGLASAVRRQSQVPVEDVA